MSRPCRDVADQLARGRIFGPLRPLFDLAQLADVVQDGPGHDQAAFKPGLQVGIVFGVFVGQIDRRAGHAQHVLQPAADKGMMVVRGGRQRQQRVAVGREQSTRSGSRSGGVVDPLCGDRHQFGEHRSRSNRDCGRHKGGEKPSAASASNTSRILRMSSCGPKLVSR